MGVGNFEEDSQKEAKKNEEERKAKPENKKKKIKHQSILLVGRNPIRKQERNNLGHLRVKNYFESSVTVTYLNSALFC